MRQYFTYRLFPIQGGWWTPDSILQTCFKGLDFAYELEIATSDKDGRRLGWIEVPNTADAVADTDKIASVLEALTAWGVHKKTIKKAQAFVQTQINKTPLIDGDKLVFPQEVYNAAEII